MTEVSLVAALRAEYRGRLVVCGVPRSGTTILARVIDSIDGAICLPEPIQTRARHGVFPLPLGFEQPPDLEQALAALDKRYTIVAFKEPFMVVEGYARADNREALTRARARGALFVWLVRHPARVYNSVKEWGPKFHDVDRFIANYSRLLDAMGGATPVVYEQLLVDPVAELNRATPLRLTGSLQLRPFQVHGPFAGSQVAREHARIEPLARPRRLTEADEEALGRSGLVEAWASFLTPPTDERRLAGDRGVASAGAARTRVSPSRGST